MNYKKHPILLNYIDFLNKMPFTQEQKITFTKKYVEILRKQEQQKKDNKKYFEKKVLPLISQSS